MSALYSALMALSQLPLLRRHIERCLNIGLTPNQIVEVFIQLTFYVGVPAVEAAMRITKEIFEERGIDFQPTEAYDSGLTAEDLYQAGLASHPGTHGRRHRVPDRRPGLPGNAA